MIGSDLTFDVTVKAPRERSHLGAFGKMSGLSGRRFLSFPAPSPPPPPPAPTFRSFWPMPSRAYPTWLEGNGNDCYAGYIFTQTRGQAGLFACTKKKTNHALHYKRGL